MEQSVQELFIAHVKGLVVLIKDVKYFSVLSKFLVLSVNKHFNVANLTQGSTQGLIFQKIIY